MRLGNDFNSGTRLYVRDQNSRSDLGLYFYWDEFRQTLTLGFVGLGLQEGSNEIADFSFASEIMLPSVPPEHMFTLLREAVDRLEVRYKAGDRGLGARKRTAKTPR